jgi:hypothetical protein
MTLIQLRSVLDSLSQDISNLSASAHKQVLMQLLNLLESCSEEIARLRQENQNLRDENNRLKGEQGSPNIRPQTAKSGDISSEAERKSSEKKKGRQSKNAKLIITRQEICKLDKSKLPGDAIPKGTEAVIIQEIKVVVEVIEFKKEVYYSPSLNKSFMAALPAGYEGEYGPQLKALVLGLKHICVMSEPKILEFLTDHGVRISAGTLTRILLKQEWAHEEKKAIVQAGFASSLYQHIDDTKTRVHGKNQHTHVLCNEFYTAYFTTEHKDRLSILDILRGSKPRSFLLNEEFVELLEILGIAEKWITLMRLHLQTTPWDEAQMKNFLTSLVADCQMGKTVEERLMEAAAIAAYHQEDDCIALLLCDDAPQFKLLALYLALCWIHEGRHYKKLAPVVPFHQELLKDFLETFWTYYHQLLAFKEAPTQEAAQQLRERFEELFSSQTGYDDLDQRIAKTRLKSEALLQVLKHPEVPLHNNPAELGARTAVRRRDVSLHTMTPEGTQANDDFMTLTQTAKKLEISRFGYFYDRVSGRMEMTSLAQIIAEKIAGRSGKPVQNELLLQRPTAHAAIKDLSAEQTQNRTAFFIGIKKLPLQAISAMKQKVSAFLPSALPRFNTS